jgi:hypothetical protein
MSARATQPSALSTWLTALGSSMADPGMLIRTRSSLDREGDLDRVLAGVPLAEFYRRRPDVKTYCEYHRSTSGQPMRLDNRPYMLDLLVDPSPNIAVQKCVQCGVTELALARSFAAAASGRTMLYVLPSQPLRNRFVANRVDRLITTVPYYRAMANTAASIYGVKAADARALKHLGTGSIHFVGSNTEGEFSEFPAHDLVVDEQDLCDPGNLSLAMDRLSECADRRILRISNPRRMGAPHSIGNIYELSDRKVWLVPCRCGSEHELTWDLFVELDAVGVAELRDAEARPVCPDCGDPFDRLSPGRWEPRDPGRRVSGYKLSKLFLASASIEDLRVAYNLAKHDATAITNWYASELGEYYAPESAAVSDAMLDACIVGGLSDYPERKPGAVVVMGADVGSVMHYKVSYLDHASNRVALAIGVARTFAELEQVAREHGVTVAVVDAHPELHGALEFAEVSRSQVYLCNFGSGEQTHQYRVDDSKGVPVIVANRTAVMDAAFADIAERRLMLPEAVRSNREFYEHMRAPIRVFDQDAARGAGRYRWEEGGKPDHWRLADVYEWLAAQVVNECRASFTPVGGGR